MPECLRVSGKVGPALVLLFFLPESPGALRDVPRLLEVSGPPRRLPEHSGMRRRARHAALRVLYESPGEAEAPGASAFPGDS